MSKTERKYQNHPTILFVGAYAAWSRRNQTRLSELLKLLAERGWKVKPPIREQVAAKPAAKARRKAG